MARARDAALMRFPPPLLPGSTIAVTAPSAGVAAACHARLDVVLDHLRSQGFHVLEGSCLRESSLHVSAPAAERARELTDMLTRDDVHAVMPPWGGEFLVEILPLLDLERIAAARPRWVLGFSDVSTLQMALTLRTGLATAHGVNLMDLAPHQDDPLTSAVMAHLALPAGASFTQRSSERWQLRYRDFAADPGATFQLTEPTHWSALDGADRHAFAGRLIGGCLDTVSRLAGSPFGDVPAFARRHADDGVVVYLENCELTPQEHARALWCLRLAGWFDGVAGVLLGRCTAPDGDGPGAYTHRHAVASALGGLGVPVLLDTDIGHRPPQLLLVNGARAQVEYENGRGAVTQTLA